MDHSAAWMECECPWWSSEMAFATESSFSLSLHARRMSQRMSCSSPSAVRPLMARIINNSGLSNVMLLLSSVPILKWLSKTNDYINSHYLSQSTVQCDYPLQRANIVKCKKVGLSHITIQSTLPPDEASPNSSNSKSQHPATPLNLD